MKDMTTGKPLGLILAFAFPLLLGNLLQQAYNVVDAAIVGQYLGANALAAVGATSSVQFLVLGFCIGVSTGFCVPISQKFGAKDEPSMRHLIFNSLVLTGFLAFVLTFACAVFTPLILRLLHTPENIYSDTYSYILIIFLGIPFTLLYNMTAGILRAIGDSRTPFLFLAVSSVSNICLDFFFISVLHFGCAGAAAATVLSQAASGIGCGCVILRKYPYLRICREEREIRTRDMALLLSMGLPMGMQFSITAIGSMVLQSSNNSLGSTYVSAFTAASRIKAFAMCPFDALASSVTTFCGQNMGAGKSSRIRDGYRLGSGLAVAYGLLSGAFLAAFGRTACMIFLKAHESLILDSAGQYLHTVGYFYWLLGLLYINRTTIQGLGYSGRTIFSGVMEMFARIAICSLFVTSHGFTAVRWADPAAWIAACLYIIPACLLTLRKVYRMLPGEGHQMPRPSRRVRMVH